MNKEEALEINRQLFHLVLGTIITGGVWFLKPIIGNLIIVPLLMGVLFMIIHPKVQPENKVTGHLMKRFERERDVKDFPYKGAIFYGIGIIAPIIFLPLDVACVVILILSVGDAASTMIGKFHGRMRIWDKTIEGSIAFVLFSFIAGMLFIELIGSSMVWKDLLILTVVGALIELQGTIDDNLAVPVSLTIIAPLL